MNALNAVIIAESKHQSFSLTSSLSPFLSSPSSKIPIDFGIGVGPIGITLGSPCYCRLIKGAQQRNISKGCLIFFDINTSRWVISSKFRPGVGIALKSKKHCCFVEI